MRVGEEIVGVKSMEREVRRGQVMEMWMGEVGEGIRRSDRIENRAGRDSRLRGKALMSGRSVEK